MTTLFSDNAQGSLAITAEVGATSLVLLSGEGGEFPVMRAGFLDQCFIRLGDNSLNEVVRITGRTGDTLTCEPTTRRWLNGTEISLTLNRRSIEALRDEILASIGVSPSGSQVFTTSGTFTWPEGVSRAKVTVIAGGGGGGNAVSTDAEFVVFGGNGGDGGGGVKYVSAVAPGTLVSVTVGAGGAPGSDGGLSSFGAHLTASGGLYGANVTAPPISISEPAHHGPPGGATGADYLAPSFKRSEPPFVYPDGSSAGPNGVGYGAGGNGGVAKNDTCPGGNGAPGVVIVEW